MDQAGPVGGTQCLQHPTHDVQRLTDRERPMLLQDVPQGGAMDVLHDQEHVPGVLALVVHADHVRVGDGGRRSGFPQEALAEGFIVKEVGPHDLDGDRPVEA